MATEWLSDTYLSHSLSLSLSLSIFLSLSLSPSPFTDGHTDGHTDLENQAQGPRLLLTIPGEAVKSSKGLGLIRELFWATYQDDPYYTTLAQSMMYYTRSCKTTIRHRATATPGDSLVVDRNDTSEHMQTHNAVAQKTILMI